MIHQFDKKLSSGIVFGSFLVVSLLLTICYKYILIYQGVHLKYTWIPDFIFFAIISLLLVCKRNYNFFLITLTLLLIKVTGSLLVIDFYDSISQYFKEVLKTVFSFSFIFFLYKYLKQLGKGDINSIFKIFKYTSLLVSISIIIGAFFSISFFKTYFGLRFGFSGLLYPSSFSSYFTIVSILVFYCYNKNIEKTSPVFMSITIVASFLIGTKAVYFFLLVFIPFLFISHKTYKNKIVITSIALSSIFTIINYNASKSFLINKFQTLYNLYIEENTLTFLLSFRNLSYNNAKVYITENWHFVNYFIGGINRKKILVEMEAIDVFLSLGIVGTVLLVGVYYKVLLKPIPFNITNIILFGTLFCIIILMGNYLKSITLSYLLSFLFLIANKNPLSSKKFNT